ncbi:hypothetical protein NC652_020319 [Populus alba x Populus x berolinensis]|nr:hypothetical protein NC652_020319 [Populus alba x Populus x berolinensis]
MRACPAYHPGMIAGKYSSSAFVPGLRLSERRRSADGEIAVAGRCFLRDVENSLGLIDFNNKETLSVFSCGGCMSHELGDGGTASTLFSEQIEPLLFDGAIGNLFRTFGAVSKPEADLELHELANIISESQGNFLAREKPDGFLITSWSNLGLDDVNFGNRESVWLGICGEVELFGELLRSQVGHFPHESPDARGVDPRMSKQTSYPYK